MSGRRIRPTRAKAARRKAYVAKKMTRTTVKNIIRGEAETKHHDYVNLAIVPSRVSTFTAEGLSQIPQQAAVANNITREGDIANPISLDLDMTINVGLTDGLVRCLLVRYTEKSSNAPLNQLGLYIDPVAASNTIGYVNNPYLFDKVVRGRFDVLWDKVYTMDNNHDSVHVRKHFKLNKTKAKRLEYNGASAVDGTNQLCLYFITDASIANASNISLVSRLIFKDL